MSRNDEPGPRERLTRVVIDDQHWRQVRGLAVLRGVTVAELIGTCLIRCVEDAGL